MIVPDVLDAFLSSIDWGGAVNRVSVSGNTKLFVDNALYAAAGQPISVDGADTSIISVAYGSGCAADVIEVEGAFEGAQQWSLQAPVYLHGTPLAANRHISLALDSQNRITPLIYLVEVIRERDEGRQAATIEADLRLFFLDDANAAAWLTDDHYANAIARMQLLANYVVEAMQAYSLFGHDFAIESISHADWGQYQEAKGHIQRIFNVELSGVERRIQLPIFKACNC